MARLKSKSGSLALVGAALLLFAAVISHALGESEPDKQRAERIGTRMNEASDAWFDRQPASRPLYSSMLQKAVDSLSDDEIRLVGEFQTAPDFNRVVFRRWGKIDPAAALGKARKMENADADEIRKAETSLEGGPGEAAAAHVFEMYLGAVDGWAEVAPKAAWAAFKKREGPFSKSHVLDGFVYYFCKTIIEDLAKSDPDLAFEELISFPPDRFEELNKASMLAGYLRGAPSVRNWGKEADRLLERDWKDGRIYDVIRTALMGRWLADAPAAAEKWFEEGNVEGLNWSSVDGKRQRHDLARAAGYWAARDFPAAWRWMKSYNGFRREGFELEVLRGASVFFNEETWSDLATARAHCLTQLAKLPDQTDRDEFALRFANALWVFDDTQFLGKPLPDKAKWLEDVRKSISTLQLGDDATKGVIEKLREERGEQPGADEPATAPESKAESKEKPKPDSEERSR